MATFLEALKRYQLRTSQRSQKELSLKNIIEQKIGDHTYLKENIHEAEEDELSDLANDINTKSLEMQSIATQRKMGAGKTLSGSILSASKEEALSSRLSFYKKESPTIRTAAYSNIGSSSYGLERTIENQRSGLGSVINQMQDLIDPETGQVTNKQMLEKKILNASNLEKSIAQNELTMHFQKKQGIDPISMLERATSSISGYEKQKTSESMKSESLKGKIGSIASEYTELTKKMNALNKAVSELSNATGKEREEKEKNLKQAQSEFDTQQDRYDISNKGGGKWDMIGTALKDISKMFGSFSSGYGNVRIDQPLRLMNNQERFMRMQNEQYSTMRSMTEGDQMSLIKTMGMYDSSKKFADDFLSRGSFMMGTKATSAGLDFAGDAILAGGKIAAGATVGGGIGGGAVALNVAGDVMASGANAYGVTRDWWKNITAGDISATARDRYKSLFEATNTIKATQMQERENQYRRSYTVGTGFGANNDVMDILTNFEDDSLLSKVAPLGVSPTKAAMLASIGGKTIGGRDFVADSIESAALVEKAGIASSEQFMQMLGQYTDIGGSNQDLYNTMKSAVTIGMDDSKNISRMVSATSSLAEKGAGIGIMATAGIGQTLTRAADFGADSLMTQSQRMKVAATSMGKIDNLLSRGGTDIYSLQELAGITEATKGLKIGYAGKLLLEKSGTPMMAAMQEVLSGKQDTDSYKKAAESLKNVGLGALIGEEDALSGVITSKKQTVANRIMGLIGNSITSADREKVNKIAKGDVNINSRDDFLKYMGDTVGARDFLSRAADEDVQGEVLLRFLGNKKPSKIGDLSIDGKRSGQQRKQAVQSARELKEAKEGEQTWLDITGFGKGAMFDSWSSGQYETNPGLMMYNEKERKKALKQSWIKEEMMPFNAEFMEKTSNAAVDKTQEQREQESGRQQAPGSLIDPSKDLAAAAKIFGSSIKEDFVKSVANFGEAVDKMNSLSSKPLTDDQLSKQVNKTMEHKPGGGYLW